MDRRIYDASMLVGLAACSAGAWLLGGAAAALLAGGALLIAITAFGAFVAGGRS